MAPRLPVSVAIVAHNEEKNLGRCLASVEWADERVVVDSGSTDRTVAIAEEFGARVVTQPWLGYAQQKNFAIGLTRHDWVLSLDADEWLPEATAAEVQAVLAQPTADGYAFDRRTTLSAGFVRHAWGKDRHVRLFRRDRGRFGGGPPHDRVEMEPGAPVARLQGVMLHLSFRSFNDYAARMNRYSDLVAGLMASQGRRFTFSRLIGSTLAAFVKAYVLRLGFLDGVRGLVASAGQAHYVMLKYAKLWEKTRSPGPDFTRLVPPTREDPDPAEPMA